MPPTPSFCEKQNTDGIVPLHAQNVKNETFTKIKSRKTQAFVEQAEIFINRYFFLAARGQLCYTKPVPTAGGVRLRRAVFCACPCIVDSSCRGLATKVQTSEAFPTCLRRPYLFPCAGKDRGEKGAWTRLVRSAGTILASINLLSLYEPTYSPYGRHGTRRLSRNNKFDGSCL